MLWWGMLEKQTQVLIGGITGGIGGKLAERLLGRGARVAGYARSADELESWRHAYPNLHTYVVDATDSKALAGVFDQANQDLGGLTGYVHCVGNLFLKPGFMTSDEEWDRVLATNLTSAFYALRESVRILRKQKAGQIVLVSSVAAGAGLANHEAIAAAKAGVEGLARAAAATHASQGIRINVVAPGLVETRAATALLGSEQSRSVSARLHPAGRWGQPEEVASLIDWLLSKDAEWCTGQVFALDGGMSSLVAKPKV